MKPKITFLMPAHNEENVIGKALDGLAKIVSDEVEVLVGLDGCTDKTKEIVESCGFAKILEFKERLGKAEVMKELTKKARGEILAVHDADWKLVGDKKGLAQIIKIFEDPQIGGIVLPPHNIPFLDMADEVESLNFLGAGLGSLFMNDFLIEKQTKRVGDLRHADKEKIIYPFTLNVYRNGIIPDATTAADDFERFTHLINKGYSIPVFDKKKFPYYELNDKRISFKQHILQRVKGHLARRQFKEMSGYSPSLSGFYIPYTLYIIKNIHRAGAMGLLALLLWYATVFLAFLWSRILLLRGAPTTREVWGLNLTLRGRREKSRESGGRG